MTQSLQQKGEGYPDCKFCGGAGSFGVVASDTCPEGRRVACGNCLERRRWEGLERESQQSWCVWTKAGHRPTCWHATRDKAENEAARLARKHPGQSFIVFEKQVRIFATGETTHDTKQG